MAGMAEPSLPANIVDACCAYGSAEDSDFAETALSEAGFKRSAQFFISSLEARFICKNCVGIFFFIFYYIMLCMASQGRPSLRWLCLTLFVKRTKAMPSETSQGRANVRLCLAEPANAITGELNGRMIRTCLATFLSSSPTSLSLRD